MRLIKPSQISGEIMTIIDEADRELIIISPYYKITKWYKLVKKLERLKEKRMDVKFYVRDNEEESSLEIVRQGFSPIQIPNLHTKMYLNEKTAIVSSMNLNISSDTNSIDIALITENQEEYEKLYEYYTRYIKGESTVLTDEGAGKSKNRNGKVENKATYFDWRNELNEKLGIALEKSVRISEYDGILEIRSSNKYEVFISNGRSNDLRISGILSGKEFEYANKDLSVFKTSLMKMELSEGGKGHYDTIWGTITNLKSWSINELNSNEAPLVVDAIVKFIAGIEQFKMIVRKNSSNSYCL